MRLYSSIEKINEFCRYILKQFVRSLAFCTNNIAVIKNQILYSFSENEDNKFSVQAV